MCRGNGLEKQDKPTLCLTARAHRRPGHQVQGRGLWPRVATPGRRMSTADCSRFQALWHLERGTPWICHPASPILTWDAGWTGVHTRRKRPSQPLLRGKPQEGNWQKSPDLPRSDSKLASLMPGWCDTGVITRFTQKAAFKLLCFSGCARSLTSLISTCCAKRLGWGLEYLGALPEVIHSHRVWRRENAPT